MSLTPRQRRFVALKAQGVPNTAAAAAAGFAHPTTEANRLLRENPQVIQAVQKQLMANLAREAPLAIKTLSSIMQDPSGNPAARVRAAAIILDKVLPDSKKSEEALDQPLSQMSAAQLESLILRLESEVEGKIAAMPLVEGAEVEED
jgi:phage terminase small subunit